MFDFLYYTINWRPVNWTYYKFPSIHLGQYGVYDAIKYMIVNTPSFSSNIGKGFIKLSKEDQIGEITKMVNSQREVFRNAYKIPEDAIVVFFAPGNKMSEVQFTFETTRRGIQEFILKYSHPTSLSKSSLPKSHFYTIISLHSGLIIKENQLNM